jgi:predicted type IV restriction endonuclease
MLIEMDVGNPKDVHPLQRHSAAKSIDYDLIRSELDFTLICKELR